MSIHYILYASGASRPISPEDIDQILTASRRNNAALGVTGMLLVAEDAFIQVLEGERATVRRLADAIRRDPRHRNFMVLVEGDAPSRAFSQWAMGFKRLEPGVAENDALFRITKSALKERVSEADGGMMLDLITAFGRDFVSAG